MISKQSLTIDWLKTVSSKNRKADPTLVEGNTGITPIGRVGKI